MKEDAAKESKEGQVLKEDAVQESKEVQEQTVLDEKSECNVVQVVEVAQADSQLTAEAAGKDQTITLSVSQSNKTPNTCEVVNLEDGDSQTSTAPQEVTENISGERKEEMETEEDKNDNQEIVEVSEVTEKKDKESHPASSEEVCVASSGQDIEILPQDDKSVQENTDPSAEVSECVKKTDNDVEVLDVEMVKNGESPVEPSPAPENGVPEKPSEPAPEEVLA